MKSFALVALVVASGCFTATDPDHDGPVVDGDLAAATPLFTGVDAFIADGDAKLLVMLRDDDAHEERLVRFDVRDDQIVELDRMPIGDGTAQIMLGRAGIVWGFGGTLPDPGRFRLVQDGQGSDLDFGTHAPSVLLGQHYDAITYVSTKDCTIETLTFATGAVEVRSPIGCFAAFKSVVVDEILGIWVRVDEGSLTSIGMIDGLWVGEPSYARTAMYDAIGPFVAPGQPGAYWFVENDSDGAHVYQGRTHEWPVPSPAAYATVDATLEAGALVEGRLWGSTTDVVSYLLPIGPTGLTVRYPVPYQPIKMVGLTGRLIVQLPDGSLLEQPLE